MNTRTCGVPSPYCTCWTNSVQISQTPVKSEAATSDRESTEAGDGEPEMALSGGLGWNLPAAPSTSRVYTPTTDVVRELFRESTPDDLPADLMLSDAEWNTYLRAAFDRWLAEVKAEAWDRLCDYLDAHVDTDVRDSVKRACRDTNPYHTP